MQKKILIICSKVNPDICKVLCQTAVKHLKQKEIAYKSVYVPGAFELPTALNILHSKDFAGYVLLGCIVKSATPHFDYVSSTVCHGIMDVAIKNNLAIGFGVITANNMEQANERSVSYGTAAVNACMAMIKLKERSSTLLEEDFFEDTDL
ncbi:6,7-dimethyl-8-ribityllumazine synthase [Neorickettsia sp. 179522]|uniref:6,7-dimethyl-8-ribityllumazine synthase n=1 Tax=Neorickettsia sp. 179522 TaxID=1714371 RepID=UPI00061082BF|nr:6,7-dimethyl-8-ribityllumazine synthase [Neorickettsia sp. 179522]KYH12486.1 6,7-dimethyl-8-ribityllumazine synthase [Neorickettsia sp. 179522]